MLEEVEAGRVSTVYAYDADRLARRTSTLALLLDAASETGTAVVDRHGRDLAGRDRMTGEMMAVVDSEVLRKMTERNRANAARRRARGDAMGNVPLGRRRVFVDGHYVDLVVDQLAVDRVVDAYRTTGTLNGTAKLLNAAKVRSATGKQWYAASVAKVIDREAPQLRKHRQGRGVRADTVPRALSRLLVCPHDGSRLTPGKMRTGTTRWYCRAGHADVTHPRPYGVSERQIMPWVKAEAARLRPPESLQTDAPDRTAERESLEAQRERLRTQHRLGIINDAELAASWSEIHSALEAMDDREVLASMDVPQTVDWESWSPSDLNEVLRALWERVELDGRMRPVRAVWRVPEWRAA
jgi:DNA invertase Pin-like site-specific DNA recombinase